MALKNMTQARAAALCRAAGCTFRKTEGGDYRVNLKGFSELTAYYTADLADAVGTAQAMQRATSLAGLGQVRGRG